MTTIDLLQRFPIHKDSVHHGKVPDEIEAFDSRKPGPTMPDPDPSQYSDAKAKLLHDMYDRAVMVIAKSQPEPKSEWEGTLWRDPRQPRARSPAYSDISDSFESSSRIEHCTNDLLSTPMTPASARFKGPDGWPLGIEVAMNDFHRGRLSTPVLQEKEFPNPLNLRKQKQKTPRFCDNGNRVRQETASGESVPSEKNGEGHHQQESPSLKALAYQKEQNVMLFQQYGERQDDPDSARLELLASQQQNYTLPQQQYDCRYQQESVDLNHSKLERQNDEDTILDIASILTLSGLKYCDDQDSLGNASSELHPALANGNVPIGLGLENAGLELSDFQSYSQKHDGSHSQIDGTCLLNNDCPKTTRCDSPPRNKETHEDAHQAEPQINALADALDEKPNTSKVLGAFEGTGVESIDLDIGCQNTFEDNENNTLHGIGPLTSEDCKVNIDSDIFWKTSAPLEDILEESEDSFTSTLNLDQGQAQHFTPRSAEPLDLQKSSRAGERRDSMLALQGPQTEPFDLSSSPECVPPTLKLTTTPARRPQIESIEPSEHHHNGASSSAPTLSAATMAELKNHARPRGRLSAAALAEMRKVAKSQPHFQTGPDSPEDQSQAEIHPLLRSKSFSRPSSQVSKTVNDPPLR